MNAAEDSSASFPEFTLAEIVDMENLYKQLGEHSVKKDFCQRVATTFSCSMNRSGKHPILWKQVQCWFKDKHMQNKEAKAASPPESPPSSPLPIETASPPESPTANPTPSLQLLQAGPSSSSPPLQSFLDLPNFNFCGNAAFGLRRKGNVSDVSELAFEARSARDNAWYDVASFLTYRILHSGELEVRTRFSGFDNAHDEWVNVRTSVRERSIPLEPSECHKVKIGDLVLCFQEREHQAIYCDAHIMNIKRRMHDARSCSCIFLVRFGHDHSEEMVGLDRICRRPAE